MKRNSGKEKKQSCSAEKNSARILIADDEEIFLNSTADLLRREGFLCDCVTDANQAIIKLKSNQYDAIIADIRMPGNPNLEFIKMLPRFAEDLSAVLVTGYPSQNTAIDAIGLPVTAYMVKPVEFTELLENVTKAVESTRLFRKVSEAKKTIQTWQRSLANLEGGIKKSNRVKAGLEQKDFVDLTLSGVSAALSDVKFIVSGHSRKNEDKAVCHLLDCPRLDELRQAVEETIDVLEKTKSSFKSSELGRIRKKLQTVVKNRLSV